MNLLKLTAPVFFFLACSGTTAQTNKAFVGNWDGTLDVGVKLRIIFHIKENGNSALVSTIDSPDQSAFGLKCDTTYISGNDLVIEMKNLQATYHGQLVNDSTIEGTFKQAAEVPLNLKKASMLSLLIKKRPQLPKAPFPYNSYDVEYDNADKSVHFGATLTVPKPDSTINYFKSPEYPVAMMITGSGQQDRDETILGHKSFAVIADYLTRNGYAVLRVDDRGIGKTRGDYTTATSADFAKDVEAGIEYLKTRPDIDKDKIGLIGHSEGGMIAPIVASHRKDIDFIILLAGPGIKIIDLMGEQNAAILKTSGVGDDILTKFIPVYKDIALTIIQAKDSAVAKVSAAKKLNEWAGKTDQPSLDRLGFTSKESRQVYIDAMVQATYSPWFRYFLAFDPQPYLEKLNCKVLALNGSRDIQVISTSNLAGIQASLKKSKSAVYETKELEGLNHLFQHCKRCTLNEYGDLEETFSPEALQLMKDWLNKNVK